MSVISSMTRPPSSRSAGRCRSGHRIRRRPRIVCGLGSSGGHFRLAGGEAGQPCPPARIPGRCAPPGRRPGSWLPAGVGRLSGRLSRAAPAAGASSGAGPASAVAVCRRVLARRWGVDRLPQAPNQAAGPVSPAAVVDRRAVGRRRPLGAAVADGRVATAPSALRRPSASPAMVIACRPGWTRAAPLPPAGFTIALITGRTPTWHVGRRRGIRRCRCSRSPWRCLPCRRPSSGHCPRPRQCSRSC